ncbi:hypothetical protein KI387_012961, partial [Taxus chinensis]
EAMPKLVEARNESIKNINDIIDEFKTIHYAFQNEDLDVLPADHIIANFKNL